MTLAFARQFELVLSLRDTKQSQAQQHFKNKCKIIQQQAKVSRVECVHCVLTICNKLNAKRQSMEVCLDLSISTNKSYKENTWNTDLKLELPHHIKSHCLRQYIQVLDEL